MVVRMRRENEGGSRCVVSGKREEREERKERK